MDSDREDNLILDRLLSQIAAQEESIRRDFVSESNCRALYENWRLGRQTDDQAKRGYDANSDSFHLVPLSIRFSTIGSFVWYNQFD